MLGTLERGHMSKPKSPNIDPSTVRRDRSSSGYLAGSRNRQQFGQTCLRTPVFNIWSVEPEQKTSLRKRQNENRNEKDLEKSTGRANQSNREQSNREHRSSAEGHVRYNSVSTS